MASNPSNHFSPQAVRIKILSLLKSALDSDFNLLVVIPPASDLNSKRHG
jgi:hypothetical protein